jgi:hypothetical protein
MKENKQIELITNLAMLLQVSVVIMLGRLTLDKREISLGFRCTNTIV